MRKSWVIVTCIVMANLMGVRRAAADETTPLEPPTSQNQLVGFVVGGAVAGIGATSMIVVGGFFDGFCIGDFCLTKTYSPLLSTLHFLTFTGMTSAGFLIGFGSEGLSAYDNHVRALRNPAFRALAVKEARESIAKDRYGLAVAGGFLAAGLILYLAGDFGLRMLDKNIHGEILAFESNAARALETSCNVVSAVSGMVSGLLFGKYGERYFRHRQMLDLEARDTLSISTVRLTKIAPFAPGNQGLGLLAEGRF